MGRRKREKDYLWHLERLADRNEDSNRREDIFSPASVEEAKQVLDGMSIRAIQKKWGIGCYETTREGKTRILRLKPVDLEIPPMPPPSPMVHKPTRKCEHGVRMDGDDRRGRSRHCGLCGHRSGKKPAWWKPLPQERKAKRLKSDVERSLERPMEAELPEEFGIVPLDRQSVVSREVV
jgi:hypothetical protein